MAQFKHYSLEKYRGPGSKHRCPNCGEKTWKPYVDEEGIPFSEDFKDADPRIRELAETVGRCDNVRNAVGITRLSSSSRKRELEFRSIGKASDRHHLLQLPSL